MNPRHHQGAQIEGCRLINIREHSEKQFRGTAVARLI